MNTYIKKFQDFIDFASNKLQLKILPKFKFVGNQENSKRAFGHFDGKQITVRVTDRHPNDIMRTIVHEMIHWKQRLRNASYSEKVREDEANAIAGRIMRDYNTQHPESFYSKPLTSISEDGIGLGTQSILPANRTGNGIMGFDPILNPSEKMFKRKKPNIGIEYEDRNKSSGYHLHTQKKGKALSSIIQRRDPLKEIRKRLGK